MCICSDENTIFPRYTWLNKNKNQSEAHFSHLLYLLALRMRVGRDQRQPGYFSRETKEPENKVVFVIVGKS